MITDEVLEDAKAKLTGALVDALSREGLQMMQASPELTKEIKGMVPVILADRPDYVLEDELCEYITAMACICVGMALEKNNAIIERAGGMEALKDELMSDPSGFLAKIQEAEQQ